MTAAGGRRSRCWRRCRNHHPSQRAGRGPREPARGEATWVLGRNSRSHARVEGSRGY